MTANCLKWFVLVHLSTFAVEFVHLREAPRAVT